MQAKRFLFFVIFVFILTVMLGFLIYSYYEFKDVKKGDLIDHVAIIPGYATILVASVAIYFYLKMEDPDTVQSRKLRDSLRTISEEINNIHYYLKDRQVAKDASKELKSIIVKSLEEYLNSEQYKEFFVNDFRQNLEEYESSLILSNRYDETKGRLEFEIDLSDKFQGLNSNQIEFANQNFYYLKINTIFKKSEGNKTFNNLVKYIASKKSLTEDDIDLIHIFKSSDSEGKAVLKGDALDGLFKRMAENFVDYCFNQKDFINFDETKLKVLINFLSNHENIDLTNPFDDLLDDSPVKIAFLLDSYKRISNVLRSNALYGLLNYLQRIKTKEQKLDYELNFVELNFEIYELANIQSSQDKQKKDLLDKFILIDEKISKMESLIATVNLRDIERYLNS